MRDNDIQHCTRCGLPQTWEITRFDKDGICNYCRCYDAVKDTLCDFKRWQQLFADHLNTYKGQFEYDVVVGFSGGKDSTYIVYSLKEHYHCNVLAVTVDFGFMPTEPAKQNIARVIDCLGVDHLFYKIDEKEAKNAFAHRAKKGGVCSLCTMLCWAVPRKIANERQAPFYILGSDRGQLLRSFSPETRPVSGIDVINHMLTDYSTEKTTRSDNTKTAAAVRKGLQMTGFSAQLSEKLYPDPSFLAGTRAYPLELLYFLFHPYNEKELKKLIAEQTNWRLPDGNGLHSHHDCELHDAALYYIQQATGNTITTGELCVDVREGSIARDEAMHTLALERERLLAMKNPYTAFEKHFGVTHEDVAAASQKLRRRLSRMIALRKTQLLFSKPTLKLLQNH